MICFDIETAKDNLESNQLAWFASKRVDKRLKDPVKIDQSMAEVVSKFGLSPLTGKIILIGIIADNKLADGFEPLGDMFLCQLGLNGTTELENLSAFWHIISTGLSQGHRLASYNGKQFDMPFIFARSIINKIPRPATMRSIDDFTSKYKSALHVDLYNALGEGSQSEWANKLGISPDLASDGKNIGEWYEKGNFEEIKSKNKLDLIELSSMFRLIEGWI